jgi:hypothetical protein
MFRFPSKLVALALLAGVVTACDYYHKKDLGESRQPDRAAPEEPLEPTFSSIRKKIFIPKCVSCHNPAGEGRNVPLETLEDLTDSPRELVLPGNVEESGLTIAITRGDDKRMPPPKTGGPLSDEEIYVIEKWIQDGAKP